MNPRWIRLTAASWEQTLQVEPQPSGDTLEPSEVRVRIEACGVCYRDLIDRSGRFAFINPPITPGHEAVGRVEAVGAGVRTLAPGDRVGTMHRDACGECDPCDRGDHSLCPNATWVFGLLADGGYADYLTAPESAFFRVPDGLDAAQAAVMHCTFGTAWRSLVPTGRLRPGARVLVTGANGGVGSAAVQIAARQGCDVIAVVRSTEHREFLEALGATTVIVSADGRFHGDPAAGFCDLALECVGKPTFNSTLRALKTGGHLIVVGNVDPERASLNLGYVIVQALTISSAGGATRNDMEALFAEHARQPFVVPIAKRWRLEDAEAAQQALRTGGVQGRMVLMTEPS